MQEALKFLLASPERPRLEGRSFPWAGVFSDGRRVEDAILADPRDEATVRVDFRFLVRDDRTESAWVRKSAETALHDRLVWVCGDTDQVEQQARELERSRAMVAKVSAAAGVARARAEAPPPAGGEPRRGPRRASSATRSPPPGWRGDSTSAAARSRRRSKGRRFAKALLAAGEPGPARALSRTSSRRRSCPTELLQLVEHELSGPSPKFLAGELGILELDSGRYVRGMRRCRPAPRARARRVRGGRRRHGRSSRTSAGPPYGYTPNVVKACVAGLLRGGKLRIQPEGGGEITAVRDAGVRDLFEKDRDFRRATFFPAGEDDVGVPARAKICKFFERELKHPMEREDNAIADAVAQLFPAQAQRLRAVLVATRQASRLSRDARRAHAAERRARAVRPELPPDQADGHAGQEAPRRAPGRRPAPESLRRRAHRRRGPRRA